MDGALQYGRAACAQGERRDDQCQEEENGALASSPNAMGKPEARDKAATAGIVRPIVASADPNPRLRLVWRRLARAALTAATLSGSNTSPAMITPTTARGAPAEATPASMAGAKLLANKTTAPKHAISSADEMMVARFDGGSAWTSAFPATALSGRK